MDPVTTGGAALRGGFLGARSAARRAALWGGRGGGNLARPSPPLTPALPANPGFRNSRFHFRPPALLANLQTQDSEIPDSTSGLLPAPSAPCKPANPGFRNSRFHFRPPALLVANLGFRNSRFHFRPPALLANPGFRNSRFHFRPPALLANPGFRNSRFHFRPLAQKSDSNFQSRFPGPKAPKAKRFRIPRVRRLKLHFPPCNVTQPRYR